MRQGVWVIFSLATINIGSSSRSYVEEEEEKGKRRLFSPLKREE